jgi:hypothetical protein
MEELDGVDTLADGWNVHATGCFEGCAGGVLADNYATENQYDKEGIAVGVGYGLEVGTDVITASDWITHGSVGGKGCIQVPFLNNLFDGLSSGSCP